MSVRFPILDLVSDVESIWDEVNEAIQGVLRAGQFILGPNVAAFEKEMADYLGCKHAIGLNSGTDALVIGLRALGIGPGDEVITTAFSFFSTSEAVSLLGATPVFVDIDPVSYNLDVRQVERNVSERTRAIIPVHLYGHAADMGPLLALAKKYDLRILEDVAQSMGGEYRGTKLGTLGGAGALSFFPSKNLGACGDGGMLVTSDDELAASARMLRVHGSRQKYVNEALGYNSRSTRCRRPSCA